MTDRRTRAGRIPGERDAAVAAEPALPPSQAQLIALQRTAGNQAVAALLQREPATTRAAAPDDGVNKAIFDKIVARHASGAELLVRFAPGAAPATANPR